MVEQRKFVRVPARLKAHYWLPNQLPSESQQALLEDISEGGMRFAIREFLAIGQEIRLVFNGNHYLPGLPELNGTVAWQKSAVGPAGTNSIDTGIFFSLLDPVTKNRIHEWLLKDGIVQREFAETDQFKDLGSAYDSSTATFQVLRAFGWGPLINLGYFRFPTPVSALNLLYNLVLLKTAYMLPSAQVRLVRKAFKLLEIQAGDDVLDIGCGRGLSSFLIASSHPTSSVIGIDLLPEHVNVATTLYGNIHNLKFEHGDALSLRFQNGSFGKVLCLEAAFHFADREKFLKEAFRILEQGGRLVVVDFAWKTDKDRQILKDEFTRFVQNEWKWSDFFSLGQYIKTAKSAGFKVEGFYKWSRRVTGPIQFIFDTFAKAGQWRWSRAALCRFNPLLHSLTDNHWATLHYSAKAHNHIRRHVEYIALVLKKPGEN
ncbi:MAG: methyltransferase domain-containing protein [Candidatus Omnitrophica bacterium]|nr:methyltransferase domain-containing protein [Candidatus Omnitrophota bacterium]